MITRDLRGFIYPRNIILRQCVLSEDGSLFAATYCTPIGYQWLAIYYQQVKCIYKYMEILNDIVINNHDPLQEFEINKINKQHYLILINQPSKYFAICDFDVATQKVTLITEKLNSPATNLLFRDMLFEQWRIGWLKITNFEKLPLQSEIMLVNVESFEIYADNEKIKLRTHFQGTESTYMLPELQQLYEKSKSSILILKQEKSSIGICRKISVSQKVLLSFQSSQFRFTNKAQRNNSIKMINGKVTFIGTRSKLLRNLGQGQFYQLNDKYVLRKSINQQQLNNIFEIQTAHKKIAHLILQEQCICKMVTSWKKLSINSSYIRQRLHDYILIQFSNILSLNFFISNFEYIKGMKSQCERTKINQQELKEIQLQADAILRNIENQIQQCNLMKKTQPVQNSYATLYNFQKQPRPLTANVRSKTPIATAPKTAKLDLNQLCQSEMSMNQFKLESILGTGAYATVRLIVEKTSKNKYAVKIYDKMKLNDTQKMNNVKREISLLKRIEHPNIIRFISAVEDRRSINLIMEYVSSTSLASYVKTRPSRIIQKPEAISYIKQLISAVKYLHEKNIAHRDIKLENILLTEGSVKLIDFGFSICIAQDSKINIFCGTPSYMSPELVSKVPHAPFTSDIWSLGILFSKLLTGEFPFKGANDKDLYRKIMCAKYTSNMTEDIQRVIRGCLEKTIAARWTIQQLASDPLFNL